MHTTNYKKFKGEIENYVTKEKNVFESRIDRTFHALNFKTQLNLVKIIKKGKQLMGLGKEQSNDFNAQVFSTTASFLRYNLLNFLNEQESFSTTGTLFEHLVDESATITYAQRLWDFFRGLFRVSFSAIFDLFKIEEKCSSYINALTAVLYASTLIQGCDT